MSKAASKMRTLMLWDDSPCILHYPDEIFTLWGSTCGIASSALCHLQSPLSTSCWIIHTDSTTMAVHSSFFFHHSLSCVSALTTSQSLMYISTIVRSTWIFKWVVAPVRSITLITPIDCNALIALSLNTSHAIGMLVRHQPHSISTQCLNPPKLSFHSVVQLDNWMEITFDTLLPVQTTSECSFLILMEETLPR